MAKHAATPNSEVSDAVTPQAQNATSTNPGTRFGKGGSFPGEGDASTQNIISTGTAGGSGNGS